MAFRSANGRGGFDNSVDRIAGKITAGGQAGLLRGALLLEGEVKTILLTPGRGRIRKGGIDRLGKGSFTTKAGVRRLVRRGIARTKVDLTNRASLPGDPPAPDTGTLQRSITHDPAVTVNSKNRASIRVGTNVDYAPILEYGGRPRGGRGNRSAGRAILGALIGGLAPRPFMRPALARVKPLIGTTIATEVRKAVRSGD